MLVHHRVNPIKIPLNPLKPPFSYGFPMVFLWFLLLQWPFLGERPAGGRPGRLLWRAPQRGRTAGAGHDVGGFPGRAAADHAAHVVHRTGVGMGMGWGWVGG